MDLSEKLQKSQQKWQRIVGWWLEMVVRDEWLEERDETSNINRCKRTKEKKIP